MARIYWKKKLIGLKAETIPGTEAGTPGAGLTFIKVRDVSIDPIKGETVKLEEDGGVLGSTLGDLVGQTVTLSFKARMSGSGVAGTAPSQAPLIVACGHTMTPNAAIDVRFRPDDDAAGSVTLYFYRDKVLHKMLGTRGAMKAQSGKRKYGYFEYTMEANYIGPVATTIPGAPTFPNQARPIISNAANTNFQMFGTALGLHEASWDFGQKMALYEHSEEPGVLQQESREATFEAQVEEPEVGTLNLIGHVSSGTSSTMSFVLGIVSGNIVEIAASTTQLLAAKPEDVGGISALRISGPMAQPAPDYEIIFK